MRFAVFTDLHFAHVFDGEWRLNKFLDCAKEKIPGFLFTAVLAIMIWMDITRP